LWPSPSRTTRARRRCCASWACASCASWSLAILTTSAATGQGIDELKRALFELVPESAPTLVRDEEMADFLVYHPRPPRQRRARIFRTDRGYRVRGEATEDDLRAAGVKADALVEFEDE
jgi:hypothetical protein